MIDGFLSRTLSSHIRRQFCKFTSPGCLAGRPRSAPTLPSTGDAVRAAGTWMTTNNPTLLWPASHVSSAITIQHVQRCHHQDGKNTYGGLEYHGDPRRPSTYKRATHHRLVAHRKLDKPLHAHTITTIITTITPQKPDQCTPENLHCRLGIHPRPWSPSLKTSPAGTASKGAWPLQRSTPARGGVAS